ncbi:hypothetical protein ACFQY5_12715 [Paeniroseomonas aquatica]|uniref:hypothetical protein n=1 Tax=Paeniroseomonas aquatica TaxID=373043 RepID=UPI0036112EC7
MVSFSHGTGRAGRPGRLHHLGPSPRAPSNVGASAAAPIVPGTGQIMGGISNAEVERTTPGAGAQAPIVPGTGRIMGGTSNAEIQRTRPGRGVQAPIVPGTGQIMGGISNAEVNRVGGGPPAR